MNDDDDTKKDASLSVSETNALKAIGPRAAERRDFDDFDDDATRRKRL